MTGSQKRAKSSIPSEVAITLACAAAANWDKATGWVPADVVRGGLVTLGFACTTQQVAAWLARMCREEAPWVERKKNPFWDQWEYRVTRFGKTDVMNKLNGVSVATPWLPTMR